VEKDIENAVVRYAEQKGIVVRKYTTPGRRNAPDRIFFPGHGVVFFVEFKDVDKIPRPGQLREALTLRGQGVEVYAVDSIKTGKAIIDTYT